MGKGKAQGKRKEKTGIREQCSGSGEQESQVESWGHDERRRTKRLQPNAVIGHTRRSAAGAFFQ